MKPTVRKLYICSVISASLHTRLEMNKRHPCHPAIHSSPMFLCAKRAAKCLHESSVRPLPKEPQHHYTCLESLAKLQVMNVTFDSSSHSHSIHIRNQKPTIQAGTDIVVKKGGYIQYLLDCNAICPSSPSLFHTSHHESRPRAHAHPPCSAA